VKLYWRLIRYLRPYVWPHGVAAVAVMLAFSGAESALPFLLKFSFDQVFTAKHVEALPLAAGGVLVLALLRGWLSFGASYLTDWIGLRVVTDLRNDLTEHLQRLPIAYYNRNRAGQIVSRVTSDAALVRSMVTDAVTSVFQDVTRLIGLAAVAVYMDWMLALIAVALFPVALGPLYYFSKRLRQASRRQQEGFGRLNAMLHENVQGNRVVKAFGHESFEQGRFHEQNERLFRIYMRASFLRAIPVTEMLAGVSVALILWYGGSSVIGGVRTVGTFVAFVGALFLLYEPFKKLVKANNTVQQGLAGAERVFALLDVPQGMVDRPGAVPLRGVRQGIEFHDVSFAYDAEPVLRHVDLRIPVGRVVALVGISGGGKSTLADLIPRFYDVTEGKITIDGVDVRDFTLQSLRAHIAVVTQFTFLFHDSVRNNIAYGEPERPMDEIIAAARAANAHDFITALPNGYDTQIGDLGVRLSGGQRQRLAIARALLKDAPILILDEATSALDTESEGLVQEALERLMVNRTTLVVAHRLSTIRRADRIVVVVQGEILESGTHDELLANGTEYRKLYEMQFVDGDGGGTEPARDAAP
jgi:subfamily B ATP-binding cassette protein MsbA